MKKFLIGGIVVVLLVAGGVYYLASNLNAIVAGVIEKQGTRVVGTDVAVKGVDISLREGRGAMSGLTIASPDGYEARTTIGLGEIVVDLDVKSLRSDPIVIEEIRVTDPVVTAEVLKDGSSNIKTINDNVQASGANGAGSSDGGDDPESQKRIRIKRFVFEKGRIELDASELGLEARTLDLPAISLNDIGGADGALPPEIARAVLGALTREAATAVAQAGVVDKAKEALTDEAADQAEKLLDKIGG